MSGSIRLRWILSVRESRNEKGPGLVSINLWTSAHPRPPKLRDLICLVWEEISARVLAGTLGRSTMSITNGDPFARSRRVFT